MGDHTTTSDGCLDQSIELLVSSDGQLEMPWGNSLHSEILGGISCELKNLGCEVLEDSSTVDSGGGTNSAIGANSALQEPMNSSDWEL